MKSDLTNKQTVIRLERLYKSFETLKVLSGVDLQVARGQCTAVIGPSGCGKSVLLKHVVGILRPDAGKVFYEDNEISAMSERGLMSVRREFGFVFQGGALFDSLNVEQNVMFPLAQAGKFSREEMRYRSRRALSLVGLDGTQERMPQDLSGGQKKRVALARAIVQDPKVILYDEPTTGLDPVRADLINELIIKLQEELHTTSLIVTHDMSSVRKVAQRAVMLHEGRFIADAPPEQLSRLDNDIVRRFVQGQASPEELGQLARGSANGERASA